jgi:Zn-dependent protease
MSGPDGPVPQPPSPAPSQPRVSAPSDPSEREPGWVIARLGGVPIVLAPSWFIVAAVVTAVFGPVVAEQAPEIGAWSYAVAAAFAVLLYASVLVHELGHVAVARMYGMPVRRVTLHLLGGVSELEGEMTTPGREFLVAVAGPVLSLVLGAVGWIALVSLDPSGAAGILLFQLTAANLLVGVFNLLPGLPLDGGRLVKAAVWRATGRPSTATRAAAWAGRGVAVVAFALPFVLNGGAPPSIASVIWGAMIAAFIWVGASQALRGAEQQELIPLITARSLVRRAIPVSSTTPLALALDQLAAAGARSLVIVDHNHRPVALVNETAVAAVPLDRRPWVDVGTVARRLAPGMTVSIDAEGRDLIDHLASTGFSEYLVLDDAERIVGVLAAHDAADLLNSRGSRPRAKRSSAPPSPRM